MSSLRQRIHEVEQTAHRRLLLHGLAWFGVCVLAAAVAVGASDYLLRWREFGLRLLASLALAAVAGYAFLRFVRPILDRRRSDLEIARRIERRFPELRDELSSALLFADQPAEEPRHGSAELRRAVLANVSARAAELDFREALDPALPKTTWRILGVCLLLILIPMLGDAASAGRAALRMLAPWARLAWPLRTTLRVDAPDAIASGGDFVLRVTVEGQRPSGVVIALRDAADSDGRSFYLDDQGDHFEYRLANVVAPFEYRVSGGDDDARPWRSVQVVAAAKVTRWELEVQPPPYTAWPREMQNDHGEALRGSQLRVVAQVDRPILSAMLKCSPASMLQSVSQAPAAAPAVSSAPNSSPNGDGTAQPATAVDSGGWPLAWDKDRLRLSLSEPLVLRQSGKYWVEVVDQATGVVALSPPRMLKAREDAAPTLAWESPTDGFSISPRATVSLLAVAKDDLALREVAVEYEIKSSEAVRSQTMTLYAGPAAPAPSSPQASGQQERVQESWELSSLGLLPGDEFRLRLVASDYAGQQVAARWRGLRVLTDAELQDWVLQRQALILARLQQALRSQLQSRWQTNAVHEVLQQDSQRPGDDQIDRLQGGEVLQRSVRRLLDPPSGTMQLIAELLRDMQANRLNDAPALQRLQRWNKGLAELSRGALSQAEEALVRALQDAREEKVTGNSALLEFLVEADDAQGRVVERLEQLLQDAEQWDARKRLTRELGKTLSDQKQLTAQANALRMKTLGVAEDQWTTEQRLESAEQAARQDDLARSLRTQQQRLEQTLREQTAGEQGGEKDPAGEPADAQTARLESALEQLKQGALDGRMRAAARELRAQQPGKALAAQQAIEQALQEALDTLAGAPGDLADQNAGATKAQQQQAADSRLAQEIEQSLQKQGKLLDATQQLDARRSELDPQQFGNQARQTGLEQQQLAGTMRGLNDAQQGQPLRQFALESIENQAAQAGEQLLNADPGEPTQVKQRQAMQLMQQLLEALQPPPADNAGEPQEDPSQGPEDPAANQHQGPALQDLQLLRFLQQQLREETQRLQAAKAPAADQLRQLWSRQDKLAELTDALARPAAEPPPSNEPNGESVAPAEESPADLEKSLDGLFDIR